LNIKNPFSIYRGLPKGIYIIFVSRIIDNMGSVVMPMITLILTQKIGFSKSEAGILATLVMISQAPFLLMGGRLIDRIGSKKVIVIFNALGAVAYLPCVFIRPHFVMALFIGLAADLFSVASPAYNAIVTEVAPQNRIKSAYSIIYLGFNLGLAIGPALAGILFNRHLHLLFLIDSLTCFLSLILFVLFVPDNSHVQKQKLRAQPEEHAFDLHKPGTSFLLHSRVLLIFSIILLGYNFCYSQWGFMLPLQSTSLFKANGAQFYSLLVSANAIAVIILTPVLTMLTHRFRPITLVAFGGFFYTLAFLIFGGANLLYAFIFATIILTIGQIAVNINTNSFIAERTPPEYIGRANSLLTMINGLGIAIGPVIMGQLLMLIDYRAAWLAVAVMMLISACGMFALGKSGKTEPAAGRPE
jgi:Arabinose efflux permease